MYVKAKDHLEKISVNDIKLFIASVEWNAEPTFGVFITSHRYGYTDSALQEAKGSSQDILLTNIDDLPVHLEAFTFKRKTFIQTVIVQENKALQDKINGLEDSIEAMQDSIEITHMMLLKINRKLAFIEKKWENPKKTKKWFR